MSGTNLMLLPRLQLFELEDFAWFPATIRDLATEYLEFMQTKLKLHEPMLPVLRDILERSGAEQIVDLCSGSGGPVVPIMQALGSEGIACRFVLTDRFPSLQSVERLARVYPDKLSYVAAPVSADAVPVALTGLRTLFNSFHHFAPSAARSVLADAAGARQPIAIFEIPERSVATILPFLFTPLYVALATPWIRPFQWKRLFWTYMVPLVPLLCWWDGMVSAWRAYTPEEMMQFTSGLMDMEWSAGKTPIRPMGHVTYLTGVPK
jgi:hypothetical protein